MHANTQTRTTGQFVDLFPIVPWLAAGFLFCALLVWAFMERTLLNTSIAVNPDTPTELPPIQLKKEPFGALRIDAIASLPTNRWVTYEIQLKDSQGNLIASGLKEAWSEAGTWAEDGESGSWAEDDRIAGLDVRAEQSETVKIAIDVLDYTSNTGGEINEPLTFEVTVKNGVIDDRFLWLGFLGAIVTGIITLFSAPSTGKVVINKSNRDSDVVARNTMGGENNLLRVVITVQSDEHSPSELNLELTINNSNGEQVYRNNHTARVSLIKSDGKVSSGKTVWTLFLVLEPRDSYGFHVDVMPDASIDRTRIFVREQSRTLIPVTVTTVKAAAT